MSEAARAEVLGATPHAGTGGTEHAAGGCAIGELFEMLGRPYMLGLLSAFGSGGGRPIRFRDLQQSLHIPPKTLADRLRVLVERGFLVRRAYREIPPRVEYEPTPKTTELHELFQVLGRWAQRNTLTATSSVATIGARPPAIVRRRATRR